MGRAVPRPVRAPCIAAIFLSLAACGQTGHIYLHNAGDNKAIAEAKAGLEASKTAYLGAIDSHRAELTNAIARERAAIVEREIARRDLRLTALLGEGDRRQGLSKRINERVSELTGIAWSQNQPAIFGNLSFDQASRAVETIRSSIDVVVDKRNDLIREFEGLGGKSSRYCDNNGQGLLPPDPSSPGPAISRFQELAMTCEQIARLRADENPSFPAGFADPQKAAARYVVGYHVDSSRLGGELKAAAEERAGLDALVATQAQLVSATKKRLADYQSYLECEKKREGAQTETAAFREAAKELSDFINLLAQLDATTIQAALASGGGERPTAAPKICTFGPEVHAKPEPVSTVAGLAETPKSGQAVGQPSRRDILRALQALTEFGAAKSLVGAIHEAAQEFRESKGQQILAAIADPSAADGTAATVATKIVSLFGHYSMIRAAEAGTLPNSNAVLIDMAAARMKASGAKIEADRLDYLTGQSDLYLAALRSEIVHLQSASQQLSAGSAQGTAAAMRSYVSSWNRGRLQQPVIRYAMINQDYLAWTDRQKIAAEASFAVLEPAIAELQVYGEGGVKPSDLARYLNTLGLGAVFIGNE
jgi:predicted small lipoprotein YifL